MHVTQVPVVLVLSMVFRSYMDVLGMRLTFDDGKRCALEFGSPKGPDSLYIRNGGFPIGSPDPYSEHRHSKARRRLVGGHAQCEGQ